MAFAAHSTKAVPTKGTVHFISVHTGDNLSDMPLDGMDDQNSIF